MIFYNPHSLNLGFGRGGRKIVTYNKWRGGVVWEIVSYNFFGPKKLGGGGVKNVTFDVGRGNYIFSTPPNFAFAC